jgi:hypothetical protein
MQTLMGSTGNESAQSFDTDAPSAHVSALVMHGNMSDAYGGDSSATGDITVPLNPVADLLAFMRQGEPPERERPQRRRIEKKSTPTTPPPQHHHVGGSKGKGISRGKVGVFSRQQSSAAPVQHRRKTTDKTANQRRSESFGRRGGGVGSSDDDDDAGGIENANENTQLTQTASNRDDEEYIHTVVVASVDDEYFMQHVRARHTYARVHVPVGRVRHMWQYRSRRRVSHDRLRTMCTVLSQLLC